MWYFSYNTPLGWIAIFQEQDYICGINFEKESQVGILRETPLIKQCYQEISEYLEGKRQNFNIKIKPSGTPFQQRVWATLLLIPYGETKSYKDIAIQIGNEKGCRAVGNANNKNPIPIIIPCHRVIGQNGKLTGYAGGIKIKEFLLKLEKRNAKRI